MVLSSLFSKQIPREDRWENRTNGEKRKQNVDLHLGKDTKRRRKTEPVKKRKEKKLLATAPPQTSHPSGIQHHAGKPPTNPENKQEPEIA